MPWYLFNRELKFEILTLIFLKLSFLCKIFKDAGECSLTPILCPASVFMLRSKMRAEYKIQGALWKDVATLYL